MKVTVDFINGEKKTTALTMDVDEEIKRLSVCDRIENAVRNYHTKPEADRLMAAIKECMNSDGTRKKDMYMGCHGCIHYDQQTGEWETDMVYAGIEFYRCDQCDFRQSEKSRYCPNCGARMNGGEEE